MFKNLIKSIFITVLLTINYSGFATTSEWKVSKLNENKILQMRLFSGTEGVIGLKKIPIAFEVITSPGWKIYWRHPGDAGLPTQIDYSNSINIKKLDIFWPAPFRFSTFGIDTFGYDGQTIFPLSVTPENENEAIIINSKINLLACNQICIPFTENILLEIPKKIHKPNNKAQERAQFLSLVPKNYVPNGFSLGRISLVEEGIMLTNSIIPENNFDLFIENNKGINFGKPLKKGNDIFLPALGDFNPKDLLGNQIIITFVGDELSFESIQILNDLKNKGILYYNFIKLLYFIFIAFIGGVILNFMPCVLPVISLKLSKILFANSYQISKIKTSFLITTLGIISSFFLLGLTLISLKTLGYSISWGMQYQNLYFLSLMSLIMFAFGLNMLGIFQLSLPFDVLKMVPNNKTGNLSDFLNGFLATLLATPCSAPFVGTAITFAFSENNFNMILIFISMGIGLSVPWFLVAFFPRIFNYFPKPGKWMVIFKKLLGMGMLITAFWIFYILLSSYNSIFDSSNDSPEDNYVIKWEKGLANLLAEKGETVIVDITADWCLTCKLNKIVIFNTKKLSQGIKNGNIKFIQGDWTLPNQEILEFLGENKRYGIPFNVIYGPQNLNGIILPEILTKKVLLRALESVK